MSSLSPDERLVYTTIRDSGNEGIWTRTIKIRTNLHQTTVTRALKSLEQQKSLIKSIKSVKYPTRKMYMLVELEPGEDVTGGAWFTDAELDVGFIETLTSQVYRFVSAKTFPKHALNLMAVYATGYRGYATARDIHAFIHASRVVTVQLSLAEIHQLIQILIYDARIEQVRLVGAAEVQYKAIREPKGIGASMSAMGMVGVSGVGGTSQATQGATELPCGGCPVAGDCAAVGPIRPDNCVYLARWLAL